MPQAVPWLIATLVDAGVNLLVAAAIAYVGVYGTIIYASVAYSKAQQRKLQKALAASQANSAIDQGRNIMVRDPVSPWRLIYGQIPVSGPIFFWEISGANNEYLNLGIVLAHHECKELGEIKFEGVTIPLDGSSSTSGGGGLATGDYAGYVRIHKFLGGAAGERDLTWESELPGIFTSDMIGVEVARLHIQLKYNQDLFVSGIPTITCLTKGKKVYDPRTTLTNWNPNWALCVADFLKDENFGKGIHVSRIRTAELIEAANISDEAVVRVDLSTESRYELHGAATSDQDPDGVLLDLIAGGAGHICDAGGFWTIRAGAWRTPSLSLSEKDFAGSIKILPRQSRQDTYNGVKGTYISALNQWAPADFPAVKNDTYMGWDKGKRLWKDVVYNWTTSPSMCQRLAKIDLEAGRQQIVFTGDFMLKALQCQPGDVIELTYGRWTWTNKYFEVESWGFKLVKASFGPALAIELTGRETAPGVFDWNDGEETVVDLAPNTNFTDPRAINGYTPTAPTLSTSNFQQLDGTISPRLRVQWPASSDSSVLRGGKTWVEYKKHADATWLSAGGSLAGDVIEMFINDVRASESYDVRYRFESINRVRSQYSGTTTYTVLNDTSAPATPSGLVAYAAPGGVIFDWDDNSESDLFGYEMYRNTVNTFPGGIPFWSGKASQLTDYGADIGGLAVGTTYYYWVKAVDRTNNKSAQTSSVNAAPTAASGTPGADGTSNAVVFLYKRSASAPSVPGSTLTYTFASGVLSGTLSGWTQNQPADDGNPCYAISALATGTGATDTIATGEWSAPVIFVQSGTNGTPGADGATVLGSAGGGGSAASSSYTNLSPDLTLAATCDGSTRILKYSAAYIANASGSAQTCYVAICDGTTVIAELGNGNGIALDAGDSTPIEFSVAYTPSAGAHTFRIRVKGSAGNSVATGGYLDFF